VNPHCTIIRISATSGQGLDDWHAWLRQQKAIIFAGQQYNQSQPTALAPASDSDRFSNAVHQQH
jgi:hydrogenase nickel incorporation protein HypB